MQYCIVYVFENKLEVFSRTGLTILILSASPYTVTAAKYSSIDSLDAFYICLKLICNFFKKKN